MIKQQSELIAYVGPMFSGKTSALLMTLERFKYQGRHIYAFKPTIDDRYSQSNIVSHMGWELPAVQISTGKELIEALMIQMPEGELKERCVVAVDEMFMIPGIAEQLIWLYKNDVTVVVSTLDLSSSCVPFEEVVKILPFATTTKKFMSVCSVCGADAHYTWKKSNGIDDEIIAIGGSEIYEPRCKQHHTCMI